MVLYLENVAIEMKKYSLINFIFIIGYISLFFPLMLGGFSVLFGITLISASIFFAYFTEKEYKFNIKFIIVILILCLSTIVSTDNIDIYIYIFTTYPLVVVIFVGDLISKGIISAKLIVKCINICVLILAAVGIIHYVYNPSFLVFFPQTFYNDEIWGSTSYRITSLFGSPQNNALLYSAGFFCILKSESSILAKVFKLILVFSSGMLTLSTFFGVSIVIAILIFLPLRFLIFSLGFVIIFLAYYDIEISNTVYEAFNLADIINIQTRYSHGELNFNMHNFFIGHGLGTATQGIIDREITLSTIYASESTFLTYVFERGIIILPVLAYLFRIGKILDIYKGLKERRLFYLILVILVANFLTVPAFISPKIIIIFYILLYASLFKDGLIVKLEISSPKGKLI